MHIHIQAIGSTGSEKGHGLELNGKLTDDHAQSIRDAWSTEGIKAAIVTLANTILDRKLTPYQRESEYKVTSVTITRTAASNGEKTKTFTVQ